MKKIFIMLFCLLMLTAISGIMAQESTISGGGSGGSNSGVMVGPTGTTGGTETSVGCEKYYTCPDGKSVQYCFRQTIADNDDGGSSGCGCKNPETLCENSVGVPTVSGESGPVITVISSDCGVTNDMMKIYDELIKELKDAESNNDESMVEIITKKIRSWKEEIGEFREECTSSKEASDGQSEEGLMRVACDELVKWQEKYRYYGELNGLTDEQLTERGYKSRAELEGVLDELKTGMDRIRNECEGTTSGNEGYETPISVVMNKPTGTGSSVEIAKYYKEQITEITSSDDVESQIESLKGLRNEIDGLIEDLIKSLDEINADDVKDLVGEMKIKAGEIEADSIKVQTVGKKISADIDEKKITIEPSDTDVVIKDENIEVNTDEASVKDGKLRVGQSEVSVSPTRLMANINMKSTNQIRLREENSKAVYAVEGKEDRKLFGFIPMEIDKTIKVDASNNAVLEEVVPWYTFMTTE